MGGNAGIRGYIIQTIICVLDALQNDNNWISVTLEPTNESEKVDIRWKYSENEIKFCQVKSSENVIGLAKARAWAAELKSTSHGASELELIVVGHPATNLLKVNEVDGVKIVGFMPIDTNILMDQASTKIDKYYETKGKPKVSAAVRELLVKVLTTQFATNSIIGVELSREEFDTDLLKWISDIEKQIEANPFASFAPPAPNENVEISHRIIKKILELIGWTNFSENVSTTIFNERKNEDETFQVNFVGDFESQLKSDTDDFILISTKHDLSYPSGTSEEIKKYLYNSDIILAERIKNKKVPINRNSGTDCYDILFWLSSDNTETVTDFTSRVKSSYKKNLLNESLNYFLVDNNRANFLLSSIVTAKNYRPEQPVKFLYPITEANHRPGQIGVRGFRLPVQFINSSIIPIIKEDHEKISVLLFCSDFFSSDHLKKLIWLTIRITSGLANEYIVYFPDYESDDHNEAVEVIRTFNDEALERKIKIDKFTRIDSKILDSLPKTPTKVLNDEVFDESKVKASPKLLNETFTEILPFGDIIKPFLKTDAITANDLKIFLAKKGIFQKAADKNKIINLMSTLLFSPVELEDFKSLIDIKSRATNTTNEFMTVKEVDTLENVFRKINPDLNNITENLNTRLLQPVVFIPSPTNANEYIFSSMTERKDPTSQISVNTNWGKVEITYKLESNNLIVNTINTVSKDDKIIANRIVKEHQKEFKRIDFVQEESRKLMFKNFNSNEDRVNFLLSFTDVSKSTIFRDSDIKTIKYTFDNNAEIPDFLKDKKDKDLITYFSGKNLSGLNEISDANFKKILLLEEIFISYKFDWLNIRNGTYSIKYNFSDALKGKPEKDGVFKSEPFLFMSKDIKNLSNIEGLKKQLSNEIEKLKLDKLQKFNFL